MRSLFIRAGILTAIVVVSGIVAFTAKSGPAINPDPNHTHADFAVWINGTQWDFSLPKYMSEAPKPQASHRWFVPQALAHGGHEEGGVIPERKFFHFHDGNGNVIHSHKPDQKIADFFASIGWQMTNVCIETDTHERYCNAGGDKKWHMFVSGKEQDMNPHYVFTDGDQLLFSYGSTKGEMLQQIIGQTADACLYSQTCPERGEPPSESCVADPAVPCVE